MSLVWDKLEVSFTKGLNQKADPRLIEAPELVRAVDVEFDEIGGLRHRKPFVALAADLSTGGQISAVKRIYANGNELVAFTRDAVLSWCPSLQQWVSRGTHLAIKNDEKTRFATTGDQAQCDRAQLSGTVVYAWNDAASNDVYIAAIDASSESVILAPTVVVNAGSTDLGRPRLVALSTKILLFVVDSAIDLTVYAIDPAAPAVGLPATVVSGANTQYYDAERIPGTDTAIVAARRTTGNQYEIAKVTAALAVTKTTKARTCDGVIAIACTDDGASAQVMRSSGANIEGDLITISSLADAATGQALGSGTGTINHITGVFVSSTCHVWWTSSAATDATDWDTDYNTVTTGGTIGTAARFIRRLSLASRAFTYNSQAYVWLQFFGESSFSGASPSSWRAQLQNTYFLYRHDGFLCSKGAWQRAAGKAASGAWNGHLPHVALTSGSTVFSWCAGERRIVPLGENQFGYSDRGPRDITFTFDSNDARRVARIGQTLYIACGEGLLQYDGSTLVETGFHLYPHYFGAIEVGAGNLADGIYTLKTSWRYDNGRGERERSTSATSGQVTIAAGPNGISTVTWTPLYVTHKASIVAESWRTQVNPYEDSAFYLTTNPDPTQTSNPNRYIANDTTASTLATFNDEFADSTLTTKEPHPENGTTLENLAPPAATLIIASADRLFLAGVAADPDAVWYSKQRGEGEIAAFHDNLRVVVPSAGGDITGLAFLNETLIVFRETAIYALSGDGYDNNGGGSNFVPRLISSDCGAVSHESIALVPQGLIFKSSKGWYILNRGWAVDYIGGPVTDYDSETVYAVHAVESQHQVRIVTSGRMLVWDYLVNAWAEWTITGIHAAMWNGDHHYLASSGQSVLAESSSYATCDYGMDVEMLIHLGGIQGFARVRKLMVLGEYRSTHTLRVRLGTYTEGSYFDDKTWTPSPTTVGGELEVQHGPSQQQHKAIRIRLTSSTTTGEKLKLSAISLELGIKPGLFRHLPAAQRQ